MADKTNQSENPIKSYYLDRHHVSNVIHFMTFKSLQKVPVRDLDEESNALSTKISELHKSPFSKTRRVTKLDEM